MKHRGIKRNKSLVEKEYILEMIGDIEPIAKIELRKIKIHDKIKEKEVRKHEENYIMKRLDGEWKWKEKYLKEDEERTG